MKIDKIDVQTSNKKHATDIAMLVDKPEFLQELEKLRQKWQITKLYKLNTSPFQELLNIDSVVNNGVADNKQVQKRRDEFNQDIDKILKKFNRGKNFKLVVEYALTTGVIPEGVYRSCYFDVVKVGEPDSLENPERDQYVIILSPRTEQKEVKEAYKEFKEHIKGKIKFHKPRISLESPADKDFYKAVETLENEKKLHSIQLQKLSNPDEIEKAYIEFLKRTKEAREYFQYVGDLNIDNPDHRDLIEQYHRGNIYSSADIDKFKTLKELERTRVWYWMRYGDHFNDASKEPKTYAELVEDWNSKCPLYSVTKDKQHIKNCPYCSVRDESYIEHALASYNTLLKQS